MIPRWMTALPFACALGTAEDPGSLAGLHDVVGGAPLSAWPPAYGWWLLLALALTGAVLAAYVWGRRHRAGAYRREALGLLDDLARRARSADHRAEALAGVATVVRRAALSAYPRTEVARLAADDWRAFLDRTVGGTAFTSGAGRPLPDLPYRPDLAARLDGEELEGLLAAARHWVLRHRTEAR